MPTRNRRFYSSVWFWCLLFAALVSPFVIEVGKTWWKITRHRPVRAKMELAILRLSLECPEGVSENQWGYCITWTWIMQGNFGSMGGHVPTDDLDRIADELNRRIDAGADLQTIDWIWDQYILAYPRIARYSESYRPTGPNQKEQFDQLADDAPVNDYNLSEWRQLYHQKLAEIEGG